MIACITIWKNNIYVVRKEVAEFALVFIFIIPKMK